MSKQLMLRYGGHKAFATPDWEESYDKTQWHDNPQKKNMKLDDNRNHQCCFDRIERVQL